MGGKGSKTKLSTILHGIFLLISAATMAEFLNKIPLACLAALLLTVGYKLAKISLFKSMFKLGWEQFLPFVITVVAIQFSDLLKGIAIGMVVAIIFILVNVYKRIKKTQGSESMTSALTRLMKNNYKAEYYYKKKEYKEGEQIVIQLDEDVSFINKGSIAFTLDDLPEGSSVVVDGSKSHSIDIDVLEIFHNFKSTAELKNIKFELKNVPEFKGTSGH